MLLSNEKPLSHSNSAIDDNLMKEFSSKISSISQLNAVLLDCINKIKDDLLKDSEIDNDLSKIRALLLLFYFPAILTPQCHSKILNPILKTISEFPSHTIKYITNWLSKLPFLLRQVIGSVHFSISMYFALNAKPSIHSSFIFQNLKVLSTLHTANELQYDPFPPSLLYNHHIDEQIDIEDELEIFNTNKPQSILTYPFALSIQTKSDVCKTESHRLMGVVAFHSLLLNVLTSNGQRINDSSMFLTLHVRRNHLLEDSINQFMRKDAFSFLKKLKVEFDGETAVDVGGPSREYMYLMAEQLFSPDMGMFVIKNEKYCWFSQCTFETQQSFFISGIIVGLAVHNSIVLPIRFPLVLYKKLMTPKKPLNLSDLASLDPDIYKSLRSILDMRANGQDISDLELTFDTTIDRFGVMETVPIAEGMGGVLVTNDNAKLYVKSYVKYLLKTSIGKQFRWFKKGFEFACQEPSYKLLEPKELDIIVSGEEVLDWDALQRCVTYSDGYTSESKEVKWFWSIFKNFSQEEKLMFLKFTTGTDRAPLGGLGNMNIVIQRGADPNRLPVSHTCFNTFILPEYKSKNVMKEKIMDAITQTEGFGIV
ncbi:ubiquitin ligase [Histomonas meleagridis]|uniref:ubiquitin ligase n=1 Tax=Histomonas meleagridis TaxID=135588 RepID=UPI00355A5487|nr:ubiquitin ligase [Histomonas meleagridis]KAH0799023.1 ubiquitin ligase [Histomonas meleagridis]